MAWKIVDYMEGQDGNARYQCRAPTVYGPLPVKHWVPQAGEKRHKVKHKVTNGAAKIGSAKDYTASRAVLYAEWLATRDGVVIPEGAEGHPVWGGVDVPGKAKPEPRVIAVHYFAKRNHWQRQHEGLGPSLARVEIPNWDWVPQVTEQHDAVDNVVTFVPAALPEELLMFETMSA